MTKRAKRGFIGLTRTFDGKEFRLFSKRETKKGAIIDKEELVSKDHHARIVKTSKGYAIYRR